MKSFMFVAFALLLVVGLSQTGQAQGFASAGALFSWTVDNSLTIEGQEVAHEGLTMGQCYVFSADGYVSPATGGQAAGEQNAQPAFILTEVDPNNALEVEFILPSSATSESGFGRLSLSDWTYAYDVDGDLANGYNAGGRITGPLTVFATPDGTFYLGSRVCVPSGAQGGGEPYFATVIMEARYLATNP